jgi:hypothetical protein
MEKEGEEVAEVAPCSNGDQEDTGLAFQRFIRRSEGQEQGKGAPLALFRFQPDAPSMPLNQLTAEEEAQPRAGDAMRRGIAGTRETAKESSLLLAGDADAIVMNTHLNALPILGLGQRDVDRSALRRIFDGIAQQVQQHLLQTVAVFPGARWIRGQPSGTAYALWWCFAAARPPGASALPDRVHRPAVPKEPLPVGNGSLKNGRRVLVVLHQGNQPAHLVRRVAMVHPMGAAIALARDGLSTDDTADT